MFRRYKLPPSKIDWENREYCVKNLQRNGAALELVPKSFQDDIELVKLAVGNYGRALAFASPRLKENLEVIAIATEADPSCIEFLTENFLLENIENVVIPTLSKDGLLLKKLSQKLKDDALISMIACYSNPFALKFVPEHLLDKEFVLEAVNCGPDYDKHSGTQTKTTNYKYVPKDLKKDHDIIFSAVKKSPKFIFKECKHLHDSLIFLLTACDYEYSVLEGFIPSIDLKSIEQIIIHSPLTYLFLHPYYNFTEQLTAIKYLSLLEEFLNLPCTIKNLNFKSSALDQIFQNLPKNYFDQEEIIEKIIKFYPDGINFASSRLQNDMDFLIKCIKIKPEIGQYLKNINFEFLQIRKFQLNFVTQMSFYNFKKYFENDNKIINDKEFMAIAIQKNEKFIANSDLKYNESFINDIISLNGLILKYLPNNYKLDEKIVLKAVKSIGNAFFFADPIFHSNREIVLNAVKNFRADAYYVYCREKFYQKISKPLLHDKEILLELVRFEDCISTLDKDFKIDFDIAFNSVSVASNYRNLPAIWKFNDKIVTKFLTTGGPIYEVDEEFLHENPHYIILHYEHFPEKTFAKLPKSFSKDLSLATEIFNTKNYSGYFFDPIIAYTAKHSTTKKSARK